MNIFVLDYDHVKNAQYHVDRHVVKMPIEAVQLLCTAIAVTKERGFAPAAIDNVKSIPQAYGYKPTHINHPCGIWVRSSRDNFEWTKQYARCLLDEYTYRYDKFMVIEDILCNMPDLDIPSLGLTTQPQCMPDIHKHEDLVEAYRNYYAFDKEHIHRWKNREKPEWL